MHEQLKCQCKVSKCFVCEHFFCKHCHGCSVGTLPTECPGRYMNTLETTAIYKGVLNYRRDKWLWENKNEITEYNVPLNYLFYKNISEEINRGKTNASI